MQTALSYRTNRDLFSNYYLDEHLPETEAWDELSDDDLREAKADIMDLWEREKDTAPKRNESQLEEKFIRPMFRKLGIPFEVEESTSRTQRRPDYGFFNSEEASRSAFERREEGGDFYKDAVAVADAKRWGRPLDTRGSGEHERDFENPSYQIHVYLQEVDDAQWAVLTDGKKWRLYYGPTSHRLDSYYEIDLPTVLEKGDLEDFKYFYLFFRHGAFLEDAGGDCFLDDVYGKSNVFAQELGEDLQDNIYEAIKILSEGFLQYPENDLAEEDLDLIHDSSLIYLYRLIFVLYAEAEGRELLDTSNEIYEEQYSLNALKQEVAGEIDSGDPKYRDWQDNLQSRLDELFTLIDKGSKSRGIPEEDLYIPAYNGGLFRTDPDKDDSAEAKFLANHDVGDSYLAKVIELLTRSKNGNGSGKIFVDYSSLDVRHLGSIYEGLLEYKLDVADEPLALDDGEYVSAGEGDDVVVDEGEVHLSTGSGERKATGSYYTPEYVVEYIVENTLEPLVDDIRADLAGRSARGDDRGFAAEFAERIFDLKILDPAMGSGHFLTSAIDYLARQIIDAQEKQAAQQGIETVDDEHDINWARRQVAQRCIYGVDLNPLAVELAKVSLWLRTLAAEQPLAFLDHHLKTGNSLVGSDIEEIEELESDSGGDGQNASLADFGVARKGTIEQLMRIYEDFIAIENQELADVKEMESKYDEFERNKLRQRLEAMANVATAAEFGFDKIPSDAYERMAAALDEDEDEEWKEVEEMQWFRTAQEWASRDYYFHWKLEYPEVFYDDDGGQKEKPGFDALIGNPPYRTKSLGKGQEQLSDSEKEYYRTNYPNSSAYKFNTYPMFLDQSIDLISKEGICGMIIPDTLLTNYHYESFRRQILEDYSINSILGFDIRVFDDGETGGTIVPIISNNNGDLESEIYSFDHESGVAYEGSIHQTSFQEVPNCKILLDMSQIELIRKIGDIGTSLHQMATVYNGIKTGDNDEYLTQDSTSDKHKKVVRGRDVDRYIIDWGGTYVYFDKEELWSNTNQDMFEACPKIIIRQTGEDLISAVDAEPYYTLDTTHVIIPENSSPYYLSCLLNSTLMNWYYHQLVPEKNRTFAEVKGANIKELPVSDGNSPEIQKLEEKYEEMQSYKEQRNVLNLSLLDYLGIPSDELPESKAGNNLKDLQMPVAGVADTPLAETTNEYEGLRIERVSFEDDSGRLLLLVDVSYKIDEEDPRETDRWDRLEESEFETYEAMAFVGLSEAKETLLREFVPVAVKKGDGFAGFRCSAAGTISPLDRLKGLTVPDIDEIKAELEQYVEVSEQANDLEEKIENTDQLIDQIVYSLYGLTDEEIEIVESDVQND
ncbi:TaqI-like C-terminal specificity domain-containing protein [Halobacterium salinarum]|nr:TaqI-like C-terminal specificity domain-containing protein [Halobacterium salinarum]MDL0135670.1 TaqI-like C-terminal specificity domain-containing protein [Halobacterium salinarum]MDL0138421.1 TaqI-like C-terminal specificity domain-containing protein [Halobacterium salinarum]